MNSRPYRATGTILVSRFVKIDPAVEQGCLQCGAGEMAFGISQMGGRLDPLRNTADPPEAAQSGEFLNVLQEEGYVVAGSGGVTSGHMLKSGTNGEALDVGLAGAASQAATNVVAEARGTAAEGELVYVSILRFQKPAVA